jgi:predicted phage tail protein
MKIKISLNIIIISLAILSASSMGMSGCQNTSPGASFNNIEPTADVPTPNPTSSGVVTSTGSVALAWTAPTGANTAVGYYIYISTDNVNYTYTQNVLDGLTTATVTGLSDGTTYYFYVKAYNGSGTGTASIPVSARVP